MRILWVKAGKLLPVDTGGKIRSYNLLKQLAKWNDTTLLSYYDGPPDRDYESKIAGELPGATTLNTGKPESAAGQAVNYFKHVPAKAPYAVTKFTSSKVQSLLSQWDKEARFDIVVCDFLSASLNFPKDFRTPTVLFQHNVESALWERQAKHERHPAKRVVFKLESAKMTRYERTTVQRFDHVIAVSDHDRKLMSDMTDAKRISVVPTGVDLNEYASVTGTNNSNHEPRVLFLGSMDWEANIDGVDFFCREIWPAVLSTAPSAKFYVVGRNPHPIIRKWASDSVEVTGRVESVLPYLRDALIFVVPLRIGGGTRLKIYEAMAAGKAVVSTTVGAEGLDVHHGQDILLADDAADFTRSIVSLLEDPERRRELGNNAARLAAQYDWATIARKFERILKDVART